ncbi:hypothetical protein M514_06817 [Trichuris suis]|uniref:Uncharacterized protein n=1 Tax=Trichuris suis TaxID=68888 RepID=A0A085NB69_9BILA|nr:hypothetical protein M513_06817 [Trichuris suis]KFD66715.1 hypothetical protein M514_06817 [Trichuris suis]
MDLPAKRESKSEMVPDEFTKELSKLCQSESALHVLTILTEQAKPERHQWEVDWSLIGKKQLLHPHYSGFEFQKTDRHRLLSTSRADQSSKRRAEIK